MAGYWPFANPRLPGVLRLTPGLTLATLLSTPHHGFAAEEPADLKETAGSPVIDAANLGAAAANIVINASSPWAGVFNPEEDEIVPYDVVINKLNSGTWVFIERDDELFAPRDAYEEWRIKINPDTRKIHFRDQDYFPISAIAGFDLKVDHANQLVELEFSPQVFAATRLTNDTVEKLETSEVLPSLFLNYDFNLATSSQQGRPGPKDLGTIMEFGYSNSLGVLTNSMVGYNLLDSELMGEGRSFSRLETTFTRDFPDKNLTLKVGDAYTKQGMLGRSVYFGGISWGTNFGLTPGFVSQPLPVVTGMSATPSTVELYINDVLRQVSEVPPGPFSLDNFPTVSGSGDARIVVRDQLGRETIIEQSFVTDSQLLPEKIADWSVEAGMVRNDLGSSSSQYGDTFISGMYRRGINKKLTVEGGGNVSGEVANVSGGVVSALPFYLLGRVAMNASSHQELGQGMQYLLGFEYQNRLISAMLEMQGATENYRQLGQTADYRGTRQQLAGSLNYSNENLGSFSLGLAKIERFDDSQVTTLTAGYTKRVGPGNLSMIMTSANTEIGTVNSFSMNFMVPLGNGRVYNTYSGSRGNKTDRYMSVTQNATADSHVTWSALAGQQQGQSRYAGSGQYAGRYGTVGADFSRNGGQKYVRFGANSSLVFVDGNLFATKRLDDSFAIAEIEGFENIGVGLGSNVLTHTNKKGVALIPRLIPYQKNSVRIDPRQLPISAGIDSIEVTAIPPYRSAVKVVFPVRGGRGALIRIVLEDGEVAPIGSIVGIVGDTEEFYVARRGEAFVTGLQEENHLVLRWQGQECKFDVNVPAELEDEVPRLGPLTCVGKVRR